MRDGARDDSSFLPILRADVPLPRSSPSITVDEKRKGLRAVQLAHWLQCQNSDFRSTSVNQKRL